MAESSTPALKKAVNHFRLVIQYLYPFDLVVFLSITLKTFLCSTDVMRWYIGCVLEYTFN